MNRQGAYGAVFAGAAVIVGLLSVSAWFQVQSLRLAYGCSRLHRRVEEVDRRSQGLERRLQQALSLARLDGVARRRFGLQVPRPDQIRFLDD